MASFIVMFIIFVTSSAFGILPKYNNYLNTEMGSSKQIIPRILRQVTSDKAISLPGTQDYYSKDQHLGRCTNGGFRHCWQPFNPSFTQTFSCLNDMECPALFKCCPNSCFVHKICVMSEQTEEQTLNACSDMGFRCLQPYPRHATKIFKCSGDKSCPNGFSCCPQRCFQHKVCVKTPSNIREIGHGVGEVIKDEKEIRTEASESDTNQEATIEENEIEAGEFQTTDDEVGEAIKAEEEITEASEVDTDEEATNEENRTEAAEFEATEEDNGFETSESPTTSITTLETTETETSTSSTESTTVSSTYSNTFSSTSSSTATITTDSSTTEATESETDPNAILPDQEVYDTLYQDYNATSSEDDFE